MNVNIVTKMVRPNTTYMIFIYVCWSHSLYYFIFNVQINIQRQKDFNMLKLQMMDACDLH